MLYVIHGQSVAESNIADALQGLGTTLLAGGKCDLAEVAVRKAFDMVY